MGGAVLAVDPALRLGVGVVGVDTLVANRRRGGDDSALERGHGRAELEGRAGGVDAVRCAVEERQAVVGAQRLIVPIERRWVIGRVRREGEHLAGLHAHHDGRAAALAAVGVHHAGDRPLKALLGGGLQVDVECQRHGAARLGLLAVKFAGFFAAGVGRDDLRAVRALEIGLERLLHARLADEGVHGIALVLIADVARLLVAVPLLGPDRADVAEDVRGVGRVVYADGRGSGRHALELPVDHLTDQLDGDVACEGVFHVLNAAQLQPVAHADNQPRVAVAERAVHAVVIAQDGEQLRARDVDGQGVALCIGDFVLFQQRLQPRHVVIAREVERRGHLHGERVVPRDGAALHEVHKAQNGGVQLVIGGKIFGRKFQRIRQLVADEYLAVAVGDDPARGLDRLGLGVAGDGFRAVFVAVDDLRVRQRHNRRQQKQPEKQQQDPQPPDEGILVFQEGSSFLRGGGWGLRCIRRACAGRSSAAASTEAVPEAQSAAARAR